ncbi:unnamed protein product, partial [Amoebophrya sp. A120]|eukprot:GSA120T00003890001.1
MRAQSTYLSLLDLPATGVRQTCSSGSAQMSATNKPKPVAPKSSTRTDHVSSSYDPAEHPAPPACASKAGVETSESIHDFLKLLADFEEEAGDSLASCVLDQVEVEDELSAPEDESENENAGEQDYTHTVKLNAPEPWVVKTLFEVFRNQFHEDDAGADKEKDGKDRSRNKGNTLFDFQFLEQRAFARTVLTESDLEDFVFHEDTR